MLLKNDQDKQNFIDTRAYSISHNMADKNKINKKLYCINKRYKSIQIKQLWDEDPCNAT